MEQSVSQKSNKHFQFPCFCGSGINYDLARCFRLLVYPKVAINVSEVSSPAKVLFGEEACLSSLVGVGSSRAIARRASTGCWKEASLVSLMLERQLLSWYIHTHTLFFIFFPIMKTIGCLWSNIRSAVYQLCCILFIRSELLVLPTLEGGGLYSV